MDMSPADFSIKIRDFCVYCLLHFTYLRFTYGEEMIRLELASHVSGRDYQFI